jgi:hypothetical protein
VSQTFQITWVGDRTRDWETDKGQFTEYKVALAGYDPSENDPEAGKTVAWSRRRDAQAPAPGDEVFGHIEIKSYDWGNKYVFKTDQAQDGQTPPSFKKASNGTGAEYRDNREDRISYQGLLQACIIRGDEDPTVAAKKYFDLVRNFTPESQPRQAVGASSDRAESKPIEGGGFGAAPRPVIEDVTPKAQAPTADDDSIPF